MTEGISWVKFRAVPLMQGGVLGAGRDLLRACDCGTVTRLMAPDNHTLPDPKYFDQFALNYHDVQTRQLQASGLSANYFAVQKARIILDEALPKAFEGIWRLVAVDCGNGQLETLILIELAVQSSRWRPRWSRRQPSSARGATGTAGRIVRCSGSFRRRRRGIAGFSGRQPRGAQLDRPGGITSLRRDDGWIRKLASGVLRQFLLN